MSAFAPAVSFSLLMAKKRDTKQLGNRIDRKIAERVEAFSLRHPMQPSVTTILESALRDWLEAHESELPPVPKKAAPR